MAANVDDPPILSGSRRSLEYAIDYFTRKLNRCAPSLELCCTAREKRNILESIVAVYNFFQGTVSLIMVILGVLKYYYSARMVGEDCFGVLYDYVTGDREINAVYTQIATRDEPIFAEVRRKLGVVVENITGGGKRRRVTRRRRGKTVKRRKQ